MDAQDSRGRCWEPCDVGTQQPGLLSELAQPTGHEQHGHFTCSVHEGQLFLLGWVLAAKVISSLSTDLQTDPQTQLEAGTPGLEPKVCPRGGRVAQGTPSQAVGVPMFSMESFGQSGWPRTGGRRGTPCHNAALAGPRAG